ncbi:hypothetical protein [Streptomyces sp. R08]|uniref:Uncharacterized protein n=1 Tax=Streptomyces sp. R08 TaxID=3238624 RepID=A0AB39MAF3_9ACTN
MATAGKTQTADEKIADAETALTELADALKAAGVTLPSLRLDPGSMAGPAPLCLVDLSRCNVKTARALAAVIRAGVTETER